MDVHFINELITSKESGPNFEIRLKVLHFRSLTLPDVVEIESGAP